MHGVFLDQQTFSNGIALNAIKEQLSSLNCYATTAVSDIIPRCKSADVIITNKVNLTADILKQLPQVKLICIAATGTNNVDLHAAQALGITVSNVSGYANQSVAQYVFAQLLEYFNQTSHHNQNTEQGLWQKSEVFCYHGNAITELAGKTLGIIGYGSLGQTVESIAKAFGMKVMIAERKNAIHRRANRTPFEHVIKNADIISLHCPQTPDTQHLVNQAFLQQMKPTAMLINTARGALIDNKALLNALQNKTISYAVLDVLEQEPPPVDHLLLKTKLSNLKITAHIAWASRTAQQRLINDIADNINGYKKGQTKNKVILI